MKKALYFIDIFIKNLTKILVYIAGIMILAMIVIVSYGVVMRYFFHRPQPISNELATILLLWSFLFAIAYVELENRQIKADIFAVYMPQALTRFLNRIVSPCFAIVYCSILTWKGWALALYSLDMGEVSLSVWAEPLFPIKIAIPFGYGLLTLVTIRSFAIGIGSYFRQTDSSDISLL